MNIIANILTDKKFVTGDDYNVVNDRKDIKDGLPTLVIGWEFTKSQYPDVDITDWKIDENTFWTFGSREKRNEYDMRLEKFNSLVVDRVVKSVEYCPFNLITSSKDEKVEVYKKIDSPAEKYIYYSDNMAFIYFPNMKVVFGIYLRELDYIGKNVKQFLSKLEESPNHTLLNIKASENIPNYMWKVLRNRQYVVPTLFYDNRN